jgi:selenocysteine lyase/cysteine desulfurase
VLTPEEPAKRGTSIAVAVPDSDALAQRLAKHGVLVASGEGRIRLSIHGFNTEQDVETALAALHHACR